MKQKVLGIFLMCFLSVSGMAQIRHVKGIKSVDLGYGITKYGNLFSAGYVIYFGNKLYGKGQVFFETGKQTESSLKYQSIGGDLFAAYNLLALRETVFINAIGGFTVSSDKQVESVGFSSSINIPRVFKYGVLGGMEVETFITDDFVFLTSFSQRYLLGKSTFGNNRWFAQVGIRYNF